MKNLKIAIIISTTRAARFGHKPAQWVKDIAAERKDLEIEIVDLRDFPMPFFDEVANNAWAPSTNEVAQRWQKKIAGFDGYIFVTAEYNHGIPAVLKNALDYAYPEWNKKAAAFVGYGAVGGARAVEQLRLVAAELQLATIRTGVYIQGADFMAVWQQGKELKEITYLEKGVNDMDQGAEQRPPTGHGCGKSLTSKGPTIGKKYEPTHWRNLYISLLQGRHRVGCAYGRQFER